MGTVMEVSWSGGGLVNGDISDSAAIDASKIIHQFPVDAELAEESTAVVDITQWLHTVQGSTGKVVAFEGVIATAATDASRTVTVDLQKSTGGGDPFATILTTTIDIVNTTTVRVPVAAVISNSSLVDGDILRAVCTVAGGSGVQAKGLLVTLTLQEST